ncbi:hypothetical protein [Antarctobacter jejuensis]|uniref:hypothetical protein n=1 Tax=Antarctobacter jejuensis TaxID=1439938 RepID=UPI003FD34A3E
MRNILAGAALALLSVSATSSNAAVIYDTLTNHSSEVATAAAKLAASLGTSASGYAGAGALGALSSSDVLFLGQNDNTSASASAAQDAAIKTFVESGGTLIKLWGLDFSLLNFVSGESFVYEYGGSTGVSDITMTAAAAGTSFDAAPAALPGASNFGALALSSLGGATSVYEGTYGVVRSYGAVKTVGSGHVAFLAWDWCCGTDAAGRDAWDSALLAAATYGSTPSPVPLPAGLPLLAGALGLMGFAGWRRKKVS